MKSYYARKGSLVDVRDLARAAARPASELGLLSNDEVLREWKKRTIVRTADGKKEELPRLILVATTGGAYRASFWTTVVLDELENCMKSRGGFSRHVRLITGASGGMVGAAYYVASMGEDGPPPEGITDLLRDESSLDSLTPVVRHLVTADLPRAFWPWRQKDDHDRGVELEQLWETLATTFDQMKDGERAGWRPSLVISPMIVEVGRRLLISNLDLGIVAAIGGRLPITMSTTAGAAAAVVARLYARSAAEFFRIFPNARKDFRLQTAIRMSATFPLASPAVSLPTDPPRRVVDAGYYDNYGVDLATSWAYEHQDWIRKNTSGVALIQIRAYPSEKDTLAYLALEGDKNRSTATKLQDRLVTSLQGLTSPLEGGLSARNWSMRFRNATQIHVLDDLLNQPGKPRLFETFIFENFSDFAMNWFISDDDIALMRHSIGAQPKGVESEAEVAKTAPEPAGVLSELRESTKNENLRNKEELIRWWNSPRIVKDVSPPPESPVEERVGQNV